MGSHASEDDVTRAALDSIRRIVQRLRVSSRAAEQKVGLSGAQLFVLRHLAEAPGLAMSELAARTLTHQSSVSVVVRRLEERGLVTRARAGGDGRQVQVSLTARGKKVVAAAPPVAQDQLIVGLRQLPPGERRALAHGLGRLARAMAGDAAQPPMFFEETARKTRGKTGSKTGDNTGKPGRRS
jgi:DNA-binding MarR family transcriptional regulator